MKTDNEPSRTEEQRKQYELRKEAELNLLKARATCLELKVLAMQSAN